MYFDGRPTMLEIIEEEKEKKEEVQLTPSELQRIVMELAKRVAKLEQHHAKF
ncbi:MAG: hypothetical protein IMF19_04505 [Proteobacteria bacterium]|nr:hypothetical protein [Pseudomonadota bacterium]